MSKERIDILRERLHLDGGLTLAGPEGKRLYLVTAGNLGIEGNGCLVAYEGGGTMFVEHDRPLNAFRLMKSGFSLRIAPALAEMVNAILYPSEASYAPTIQRLTHIKED